MPAAKLDDRILTFTVPHLTSAGRERLLMLDTLESRSGWDEGWGLSSLSEEPSITVKAEAATADPSTVVLSLTGSQKMYEHTAKSLLLDLIIFALSGDIASFRRQQLQGREDHARRLRESTGQ